MINRINVSNELVDRYSLVKCNYYGTLYKKFSRKLPAEKRNDLLNEINNQYIDRFIDMLKFYGKGDYLENFYSNLSNTKIINNKLLKRILLGNNFYGENLYKKRNLYLVIGNQKDLIKNNAELTPYHELFHLATTRFDDENSIRVGFQYNTFGFGINEGVTEILTKKYFTIFSEKDFDAYPNFTWFAEMLMDLIGESRLEDLYFNSDLEGLIATLEKYLPREKVFSLIEDIDLLFNSEDELYFYQNNNISKNKELDNGIIDTYYNTNLELRNRIYNSFVEMSENKQKLVGFLSDFKERNDVIKEQFDKEDKTFKEYYKNEYKTFMKKR